MYDPDNETDFKLTISNMVLKSRGKDEKNVRKDNTHRKLQPS